MVKLTKIYTRTGDDGSTGLGSGARVRKDDPRVVAYGEVDETNASIGVAVVECERTTDAGRPAALKKITSELRLIQNDLFDVGADLCVPIGPKEDQKSRLRVVPAQTARLERIIDELNADLPVLNSFVLPGGTPAAAALHTARVVSRRAERAIVTLMAAEPNATNPETVRYLNRLSDLLFVMARAANAGGGGGDVLWKPGATRAP
jgi:cob(I)alamin adenosyltransferase